MKISACLVLCCLLLGSMAAVAVQLESFSLGFHLIPSVERMGDRRTLDLTLSFGAALRLDRENHIDFSVMTDSGLSSLGTNAEFVHQITDKLQSGFGVTVLWPFSEQVKLQWPILGTYAHAGGRTEFTARLAGVSTISFPLLTLANDEDGWSLLPIAELPTLTMAADITLVEQVRIQPRLTLQPVIIDTTLLVNPVGRVSDELLILPMGSVFLYHAQ